MSTDEGEIESLRKEMRDLREWVREIDRKLDKLYWDHTYLHEQVDELDGRVGRIADGFKEALAEVRQESRQELREEVKDLRSDLNDLRSDLNSEVKELRAELNSEVKDVRKHLENQLRVYFRP